MVFIFVANHAWCKSVQIEKSVWNEIIQSDVITIILFERFQTNHVGYFEDKIIVSEITIPFIFIKLTILLLRLSQSKKKKLFGLLLWENFTKIINLTTGDFFMNLLESPMILNPSMNRRMIVLLLTAVFLERKSRQL